MTAELKNEFKNSCDEMFNLFHSVVEECKAKFSEATLTANEVVTYVHCVRQLEYYLRVSRFVVEKVNTDEESNAQMYLNQLRTLADLASSAIYLLSEEKETTARICLCLDLLTFKKISEEEYVQLFAQTKKEHPALFLYKDFPQSHESFSWYELKKLQQALQIDFLYPTFQKRLNAAFINKSSVLSNEFFKNDFKEVLVLAHEQFSNHVHGNHLFKDSHGSELYWINLHVIVLTFTLIEIIQTSILEQAKSAVLRRTIIKLKNVCSKMQSQWRLFSRMKHNIYMDKLIVGE